MATENVFERPLSLPLGDWNLPPWIELILRKVRHSLMTDEDKRILELAEFGAATFGKPVLEARDVDDLDDRIDALLERPQLSEFNAHILAVVPAEKYHGHSAPQHAQSAPQITAGELAELGIGAPELFAQALNVTAHILQFRRQFIKTLGPQDLDQVMGKLQQTSLLSLCLDTSLPPELGLILFAWFRADVCGLAFCEMVISKRRVEPWLAMGIAQRWVDGAQKYLRLMASCPGVDVPVEFVPENERLNLPRIFAQYRAERERSNRMFEEAEASGLPIYPPGGFDDD